METPPIERSISELPLSSEEVSGLSWIDVPRKIALNVDGIIMKSELVTRDDSFGYVVRYDAIKYVEDDGQFHPEDGMKGTIHKVETKVVVHSRDGIKFDATLHPLFELPNRQD